MALQVHSNIIAFSYLSDMILYLGVTALQDDFKIAEESYKKKINTVYTLMSIQNFWT